MSSDPEPWRIPSHWCWSTFAHAAEIAQDLVDPALVPNMPHIAPNNIGVANRQLLTYATVKEDGVISPKQRFRPNQILFTKIRPYLLKSAKVDFEGVCSADMYPLWARQGIDPDYLLYWITSPDFREAIAHSQGRSVLPKINQADLNATPFPMPSTGEQRRIVAKIDSISAKSKRVRDHLNHVSRLVTRYKGAILDAAFLGKLCPKISEATEASSKVTYKSSGLIRWRLPELPTRWTWAEVADVAAVTGGLTKNAKRESLSEHVPYLRVANVYANRLDLSEISEIGCTKSELEKTRLMAGDLLIVEGNGSRDQIGRVAIWDGQIEACSHQNHLIRARVHQDCSPEYVLYWMLAPLGRRFIEEVASSSSGLHTLSISKVQSLPLPMCSTYEQKQIVGRIKTAFAWIDRLAAEATSAHKLIDRLDQAVLAKAFRGELVPQDPDDEPAGVLLDRLKAERLGAPAAKRRGRPLAPRLL